MKIEIDTAQPLSEQDKGLLTALLGLNGNSAAAPARKAAKRDRDFPKQDERQEAEPTPVVEAAPAEEADDEAIDAAVARASELLSNGERERVMAALKVVGAPKVSEVPADKIGQFMKALNG